MPEEDVIRSSSTANAGRLARPRAAWARFRRDAAHLAWVPLDACLYIYRSYFPSVGASFYDDGMQLVVRYRMSAVQRMERLIALSVALLVIGGALAWAAPISFTMDCTISQGDATLQDSLSDQMEVKLAEAQTQLAALKAQRDALVAAGVDAGTLAAANQKIADAEAALATAATAVSTARSRVGTGQDYFKAQGGLSSGPYGDACTQLTAAIAQVNQAEVLLGQVPSSTPTPSGTPTPTGTPTPSPSDSASPTPTPTRAPTPNISITDTSVTEGDTGTQAVNVTVTLSEATTQAVTVDFATADNSATSGADYQSATGTVTFAIGETSETLTVRVVGDTADEPNESFFVNLLNATGGTITDNRATVTITDDDLPVVPDITIADASTAEENSGSHFVDLTVSLSQATTQVVTTDYATSNGTASAPGDYALITTGTLSFAIGETSKTIPVGVAGDTADEADETFKVDLSNAVGGTITDNQATVTITDDDVVDITVAGASIAEGDTGTSFLNVVVSLSQPSVEAVILAFATSDGTANTPSDYASTSGTLTFNAGETTKTITVAIAGDTVDENDETFRVDLSNAVNGNITDDRAIVTITDDDDPLEPDVTISDASAGDRRGEREQPQTPEGAFGEPTPVEVAQGGGRRPATIPELLIETAQAFAFPLFLVILVILFLLVQSRIDRNDPKLAHAPTHNDFLEFV